MIFKEGDEQTADFYIFIDTLKEIEFKQKSVSFITYYNKYSTLDILCFRILYALCAFLYFQILQKCIKIRNLGNGKEDSN